MEPAGDQPYFIVKCMTFRNQPLYQAFISQNATLGLQLYSAA